MDLLCSEGLKQIAEAIDEDASTPSSISCKAMRGQSHKGTHAHLFPCNLGKRTHKYDNVCLRIGFVNRVNTIDIVQQFQ